MALSRDASAKEDSERGASEPILGTRVFDSDDGGSLSSAADGDDANEQNEVRQTLRRVQSWPVHRALDDCCAFTRATGCAFSVS